MLTVCFFGAAGAVGSSAAASLVTLGVADKFILVDTSANPLAVCQMDLSLLSGTYGGSEVVVGQPADAAEADIVIVSAGVPHRDGSPRSAFAQENCEILRGLLGALPAEWDGLLLIASNPVDVLVTDAHRRMPRATVLGYTRNDSLRLAQAIGDVIARPARQVQAWALGEHGPAMVPLFDRTRVAGAAVALSEHQQQEAMDRAVRWYSMWQGYGTGRTSMWTTGSGLAELVSAYLAEEPTVQPGCAPVDGRYAVAHDVCLGQPVRLCRRTAHVLTWRLSAAQEEGMRRAADLVAALVAD